MSEVLANPTTFFDRFAAGQVARRDVDDFISAWHATGDEETRELSAYLGFTDAEWDIYVLDRRILPRLVEARRTRQPFHDLVAAYVGELKAIPEPSQTDTLAMFRLTHWLRAHGTPA